MKTYMRINGPLTVDAFFKDFSLERVMSNVRGPFARGLPSRNELSKSREVADVFRCLLKYGVVGEGSNDEAIQLCHRKGWIYAEDSDAYGRHRYLFPSPLHHAALSWSFMPRDDLPAFESPYALCLEVLKRFNPSQRHVPIRRVGGIYTADRTPEAQYQDEFYRCLFDVTRGNVCIAPEFASERGFPKVTGRIDFFIPTVKWGIEITCEGDRLMQHALGFMDRGAYEKWLNTYKKIMVTSP